MVECRGGGGAGKPRTGRQGASLGGPIERCGGCGALRHPPGPACPRCGATRPEYLVASGRGKVYSYVVHHHPPVPGRDLPIVIALVELAGFRVVDCRSCGGVLKPDVVFFGENVPPAKVEHCYGLVERSRALLVLGSSLTVMSGLRFVKRAAASGIPVGIVNEGVTRGDDLAALRVSAPLGRTLTGLVRGLR